MSLGKYLTCRLKEPSTWRGIVMLFTSAGIMISPEMMETIVAVGTGVVGLIGSLSNEQNNSSNE